MQFWNYNMVFVYCDIGITDFTMVIRKVFQFAIAH